MQGRSPKPQSCSSSLHWPCWSFLAQPQLKRDCYLSSPPVSTFFPKQVRAPGASRQFRQLISRKWMSDATDTSSCRALIIIITVSTAVMPPSSQHTHHYSRDTPLQLPPFPGLSQVSAPKDTQLNCLSHGIWGNRKPFLPWHRLHHHLSVQFGRNRNANIKKPDSRHLAPIHCTEALSRQSPEADSTKHHKLKFMLINASSVTNKQQTTTSVMKHSIQPAMLRPGWMTP